MSNFDDKGNYRAYGTGFKSCNECAGGGFVRVADAVFPFRHTKCVKCKGVGQTYLDPIPDKT